MEYIKTKCKKCGYVIEMPEKTGSVTCGSCGHVNTFGIFSSAARADKTAAAGEGSRDSTNRDIKTIPDKHPSDISKPSYRPQPAKTGAPDNTEAQLPVDAEDEEFEFPEQKTASRIITLIFVLTPFIAMAVEFFKLPPYAAVAVIILIVVIALAIKKRS